MNVSRSKIYDLMMAAPVVGLYGWTVLRIALDVPARWSARTELVPLLALVRDVLNIVLLSLIVVLFIVRRVPVGKLAGKAPGLTAFGGTFSIFLLYQLPFNTSLSITTFIVSMTLMFIGLSGTIYAFVHLGRQISIMPEARKLVTSGPYKMVRHPAYLFEQIAFFGVALQHEQPAALLLYAAQTVLQICRTFYEERVLTASFPEYADYAARTPRLLPFALRRAQQPFPKSEPLQARPRQVGPP